MYQKEMPYLQILVRAFYAFCANNSFDFVKKEDILKTFMCNHRAHKSCKCCINASKIKSNKKQYSLD